MGLPEKLVDSSTAGAVAQYPEDLAQLFEGYLSNLELAVPETAVGLRGAMEYSLRAGGKRIRPVIALATQRSIGRDPRGVLPLACAIEMIHTYSLIHDDLPAMDDDDLRRGKPTLHRVEGEATAILAGDALYAEAISHLLGRQEGEPNAIVSSTLHLTEATGLRGMVAGQYIDVAGIARGDADGLAELHSLKTGALIRASAECVLLIAGEIDPKVDQAIRAYSQNIGLLFQIVDDILDVDGQEGEIGKPLGSDERQGKRTFVSEYGLDGARKMAEAHHGDALGALGALGSEAAELRAIADHVATRTK